MNLIAISNRARLGGPRPGPPDGNGEPPPPPETQDTGGLNTQSTLNDQLLWAVVSGDHPRRDRKGGYDAQSEQAATIGSDAAGFSALHTPRWDSGGWFWPAPTVTGKEWTWQFRLRLHAPTAGTGYEPGDLPKLFGVPYHDDENWEFPFSFDVFMLSLVEGQTSAQARIGYAVDASTRRVCTSPTGFLLLNGTEQTYGIRVRDSGTDGAVDWWRAGAQIGTTSFNGAHAVPDFGAKPYLIALGRNREELAEGTRGTLAAAGLWGKALSNSQMQLFHSNPWDLEQVSTDPPVPPTVYAWSDQVDLPADATTRIHPLANDSGAGLTVHSVTQPQGVQSGTAVAIASGATAIDVTIAAAEVGQFSFTYTATDGTGQSTATVTVAVSGTATIGADDSYTLAAGQTHRVAPLVNDQAPEGSTIINVTQPQGAQPGTSVAIAPNNTEVDVTLASNQSAPFTFTYTGESP